MAAAPLARQLSDEGYCVAERVLDPTLLAHIQGVVAEILPTVSAAHRARNRSQGSLVHLADHPAFAPLIGCQKLRDLFGELGFADPRFSSGYLISKPPKGPALFWHQDWWGWDDPISYSDAIPQVFAMFYLTNTSPRNGCLRVIPGSHRRRHALHAAVEAHAEALSEVQNPDDMLYGSLADEVAVPVSAGDVVLGDARLLHGAFANQSDQERSLITLWYHPDFRSLPAPMQVRIREIYDRTGVDTDQAAGNAMTLDHWPDQARQHVAGLLPTAPDGVMAHSWNRTPDWSMRN